MEQVAEFGAIIRQQTDALWDRLHQVPFDYLLMLLALATLITFVLLISRLRAWRAYRRLRDERDTLNQQLATLQSAYDKEILWRTASEKYGTSKAINPKDAVEVERR